MIKGTPQFDGLAVMELEVSFIGGPAGTVGPSRFVGKAAFISTQTGQTHGSTSCFQWSQETLDKLNELRGLMERDLGMLHFSEGGTLPEARKGLTMSSPGGIGENLQTDEAGVSQT